MVVVGRNAWRVETADALAFLVDGEEYFRQLDHTLRMAQRSIRIVGWDFDPDIKLRPLESEETLGDLLRALAERSPRLEIYILVWAMGPIYSGHTLKLFTRPAWAQHKRIYLRFDSRHAVRGAHHQKMVTVDDATAFVGGIDLTAARWDSPAHLADCPQRVKPDGQSYGPVHDLQTMFCGPAALAIADLARWRWVKATGEEVPKHAAMAPPWPEHRRAEMTDCMVAIARATPSLFGMKQRRETIRLTHDAIAAAKRHIYIETQYLASFGVGKALAARLREADGPEILIVVTESSRGILEQFVMAHNRDRLIRRLKKADRYDRLKIMYAVVPDKEGGECEVLIHSKVLIVDDVFVRIGSSNLNNRSEGLDTECDIAVEAASSDERRAIAGLRDRLLAEHVDTSPEAVAAALNLEGSLLKAVERLNHKPRGLRPINAGTGRMTPLPGTGVLDPKKPFWPLQKLRSGFASVFSRLFGSFF